jgi:hypothetical protein
MKLKTLLVATLAATVTAANARNILQMADPEFETLPTAGMVIYKSPGVGDALKIEIDPKNDLSGGNSLKISLPVAALASVSFPMDSSSANGSIRFGYRGELSAEADVKLAIQSYTMNGGFKSVDFKPLFPSSQISSSWNILEQGIERAKDATHWQFSITIKGPATVWIDQLSATGQ